MKQLKIKTLRAKTPEEIARLSEEESNNLNSFATQIHQDKITNQWISFLYYSQENETAIPYALKSTSNKRDGSSPGNSFKPTDEQLKRWKNQKITKKTFGLLIAKGYSKEDIKNMKNQYAAYLAIKNLKKENI